jgi:hypothetical protein
VSWTVGKNHPGYLPESDVEEFDNWGDAQQALSDGLRGDYEFTVDVWPEGMKTSQWIDHITAIESDYQQAIDTIRNANPDQPIGVNFQKLHYWVNFRASDDAPARTVSLDDELAAPGPEPHPTTPIRGRTAETPS